MRWITREEGEPHRSVNFLVRPDIDKNNFRTIIIGKIEDQPVLVRNPERPEPFHDPTQGMGLERRVKRIVRENRNFLRKLRFHSRVPADPFTINTFELVVPDEFNHSDPPGDPLQFRSEIVFFCMKS